MKFKQAYPYLLIAVLQVILLFFAFPSFFPHPSGTVFCNYGDGIKNYFTLYSYVKEPIGSGGLFKYGYFNYPFGDYVYYTDNTPAFSIPFKWLCTHIYNCSAYTIPAFNAFILANIVLCSLLTFSVYKRLVGKNMFAWLLAIVLPWVNVQVARLWEGDFNLSCSCLVLAAISLFIYWYDGKGNKRRQITAVLCMALLAVFSFLMHGYYIAIISCFIAGMQFFSGVFYFKKKEGGAGILYAFVFCALSLVTVWGGLQLTDKYLPLRKENAMGYDLTAQKTNFSLLFTHPDYYTVAFPFASTYPLNTETLVYLGNPGLFALLILFFGCLFSTPFRMRVAAIQKVFFSDPVRRSIFWGGLLCLIISFGEWYATLRYHITVYTPMRQLNELGSAMLLLIFCSAALIIYGIILMVSKPARQRLAEGRAGFIAHPYQRTGVILCGGAIIYLFVAQFVATIPNLIDPFFYLHFLTKRVEQFRCLARFVWPFFWAFYAWVIYTIAQLYYQSGRALKIVVILLVVVPAFTEVNDHIQKLRRDANQQNLLSDKHLAPFGKLHIRPSDYQAILPIPYYTEGSEDYPHTINDNNEWCIYTMQLALYGHLPLMSCKMSRTPPEFSLALLNMVCYDTLAPSVASRLNNKPILIAYQKTLVADSTQATLFASGLPPSKEMYLAANGFPQRHHLMPVDSLGDVIFYSWAPGSK